MKSRMKKIIYFDMDGVLADFESGLAKVSEEVRKEYEGRFDEIPGLFSLMEPMPGAAYRLLYSRYPPKARTSTTVG